MVLGKGFEPLLTAHLANRGYKSRRATITLPKHTKIQQSKNDYYNYRSHHTYSLKLAEDTGIEPVCPFLNESLANSCRTLQHIFLITGGSGEIRTHGPISEPTVFKTVPINRTLAHFHKTWQGR